MTSDRSEWRERFDAAELAYGVINDIAEVWDHPVEHALALHGRAALPDGTEVAVPRSPVERTFGRLDVGPVPGVDAHRREVLAEIVPEVETHT